MTRPASAKARLRIALTHLLAVIAVFALVVAVLLQGHFTDESAVKHGPQLYELHQEGVLK